MNSDAQYERFLQLFSTHRAQLFAYVYSLLPNHADAEDVFQRCSLLLWRKFDQFEPDGNFLAWSCGVAFYEVKNFLRTNSRDRLQFDVELLDQISQHKLSKETTQKHSSHTSRMDALRGCLDQLKSSDRDLIDHAYRSETGLQDFATRTGKALQTLYNRLSIVRRMLLQCVQNKMQLEGEAS